MEPFPEKCIFPALDLIYFVFLRQSHTVQAGLECLILLHPLPKCWDYRHKPSHLVSQHWIFRNISWEFCTSVQCILITSTPLPSNFSQVLPQNTLFLNSYFFNFLKNNLANPISAAHVTHGCRAMHQSMSNLSGAMSLRRTESPSPNDDQLL